ncbi:WhiB family transcriptional regulator [Auraticoccus monumenti]|uniref:4Fe-4S Wbl-type domain-containing protein n=1 Tax=Auraticoccus monumenti TaxID=675864 RepID=A0A1G6UQI3_9ACTN|nr:WhiB family transcriptional regulator [Auraticoccus monumenti]SDD42956.1 hypothetical protein SAMN04489747_0930 [Auraticoccus monumenti]
MSAPVVFEDWMDDGACSRMPTFTILKLTIQQRLCGDCPVRVECLAYGRQHGAEGDVWGGEVITRPKTEQRTCPQCGSQFETTPSSQRRFCSSRCGGLFHSPPKQQPAPPRPARRAPSTCEICGTGLPHQRRRYCSRECWNRARALAVKPVTTCEGCGTSFTPPRNRPTTARFCSRRCSNSRSRTRKDA